tara:strand:+ start:831 stop:1124 length:294 start_codon:yes stop_codon:yes gene_type:complete
MKNYKRQIIKNAIVQALRNGKKQAMIDGLTVDVNYEPQRVGTMTQQNLYFEKWLDDIVTKTYTITRLMNKSTIEHINVKTLSNGQKELTVIKKQTNI